MKYELKTLEDIALIVPVGGGDAVAKVYQREHAQTLLDALNFVQAHPIECERMIKIAEAELMQPRSELTLTGFAKQQESL